MAFGRPNCFRELVRVGAVAGFIAFALTSSGLVHAETSTGTAASSPPPDNARTDDDDVSVRIQPQAECLGKAGNWTEPEKWAWQQICARERVDFDKRYGKETSPSDLDSLRSDPTRRLGAGFVRELFENPKLSAYTQNAAVDISGAYIPTIHLTDTNVGSLRLAKSKVNADISLDNVTILRSLIISASSVGDVDISRVRGGDININNSQVSSFQALLLNIGRLSFVGSHIDDFALRISRLAQQLAILQGSAKKIVLDDVKSDGLFIRPGSAQSVSINDYVDSGMFYLDVQHWEAESSLKIATTATGRSFLRGKSRPDKISIAAFSFQGADWGPDPLPYLKANTPYNPALYTNLASSYTEAGQPDVANAILIEKQNAEFKNASSFVDRAYLFIIWLLADYGYRPELGLLWIAGFVLVSAIIFKTGANRIKEGNPPGSWLVFAFDSAIPGIQLNKEHADVQFVGWRQGFLYFLRFLSAVVVVLVIEMMKKSLSGL